VGDLAADVKIEELSSVKKKLSLEIPWAEVKTELDQAYRTIGRKAKVKGFRPGKTPRKVLEQLYKREAEDEAITNLISKSYSQVLEENKIMAVNQPDIDQTGIESEKDFTYTATVEVEPVFEPADYEGLAVEKEQHEVTEADINARIDQLRQMYSTLESIEEDRDITEGDFALIDFEGKLDGEVRKEMSSESYLLEVGAKTFIPGFEEQVIGMKKDESKEISVTFPDDYQAEDFAGKEAVFSVTVKDLKEKKMPDLDEEFIKNFEKYETIDDLMTDVRETLEKEHATRIETNLKKNIVDRLLEKNEFELPATYINRQVYYMMLDAERRMVSNGMNAEKAKEISFNLHERFEGEAERMVRTSLLLGKIAEKESIKVEDEDIENRLKDFAGRYAQDYETVKEAYEKNNMMERLKDEILEQKTLEFLESKADVTIVEVNDETPSDEEKAGDE